MSGLGAKVEISTAYSDTAGENPAFHEPALLRDARMMAGTWRVSASAQRATSALSAKWAAVTGTVSAKRAEGKAVRAARRADAACIRAVEEAEARRIPRGIPAAQETDYRRWVDSLSVSTPHGDDTVIAWLIARKLRRSPTAVIDASRAQFRDERLTPIVEWFVAQCPDIEFEQDGDVRRLRYGAAICS